MSVSYILDRMYRYFFFQSFLNKPQEELIISHPDIFWISIHPFIILTFMFQLEP